MFSCIHSEPFSSNARFGATPMGSVWSLAAKSPLTPNGVQLSLTTYLPRASSLPTSGHGRVSCTASGVRTGFPAFQLQATSSAVNSPQPLWNWTPSRSLKSVYARSGPISQDSASQGWYVRTPLLSMSPCISAS